jgi:urease gamma subunit
MRLNPKEQEKLMLHMAGNLAKERKRPIRGCIEISGCCM